MATRKILQDPHPTLRKTAEQIRDFSDPRLASLIQEMKETMTANDGWGLAAPQVNESLALFVIAKEIAPGGHAVFINPKIISASKDTEVEEEGCLSFEGRYSEITRSSRVEIEAQDEHGKKFSATGTGVLARAFLHEADHLNGILFIDHLHEF